MTNETDTTNTAPDDVDELIKAAQLRLAAVDDDIWTQRERREAANIRIKELRVEQARLERIVRATQPRTKKAAGK